MAAGQRVQGVDAPVFSAMETADLLNQMQSETTPVELLRLGSELQELIDRRLKPH